ncbi:phosphoadenylyl-sulfate reductase [Flavobacterium suzhouense]|uniref:Adenosine 5'-phosphosulfate reductase n=1 Tax=Flavobacterium suzhouense TaxID=1529638 RepID=A0ABW5NT04_9FLAO
MNISFLDGFEGKQHLESDLYKLSTGTKGKIVFSTSFGIEDQVLTHAIFSQGLRNIEAFTLDTGRLFPETYATWEKTQLQYGINIKSYSPNTHDLEHFVDSNGINGFYESQELRKECCYIRKVGPLKRALKDAKVWITGLRAEQSDNRIKSDVVEWDSEYQLYKYSPLLHWTTDDVLAYIKKHGIPYNPLHDRGFLSIGCAPCTRAVREGEDLRAGRWWWEDSSKKECGLHR